MRPPLASSMHQGLGLLSSVAHREAAPRHGSLSMLEADRPNIRSVQLLHLILMLSMLVFVSVFFRRLSLAVSRA